MDDGELILLDDVIADAPWVEGSQTPLLLAEHLCGYHAYLKTSTSENKSGSAIEKSRGLLF